MTHNLKKQAFFQSTVRKNVNVAAFKKVKDLHIVLIAARFYITLEYAARQYIAKFRKV